MTQQAGRHVPARAAVVLAVVVLGAALIPMSAAAGAARTTPDALSTAASPGAVSSPPGADRGPPPPRDHPARGWVVTLGDSYISGEGARWAGNTAVDTPEGAARVDALGPDAYRDPGIPDALSDCHRAEESVAGLGFGRLRGKNFACSGAQTSTQVSPTSFTPGLDFYHDDRGRRGQALMLQQFAQEHRVTDVVISIGGNDFDFAPILRTCVLQFVSTVGTEHPQPCFELPHVQRNFSEQNVARVTQDIARAFQNVATAMERAGYEAKDYAIVVMTYPSPVPPGPQIRYPETLQARFVTAGCPLFDEDATQANTLMLPTINGAVVDAVAQSGLSNVSVVDMTRAFYGHRLCEQGISLIENSGHPTWRDAGAVDDLAWVNEVYGLETLQRPSPWQRQESVHPNYWGTLAERSCIRQSIRGHGARSGTCLHVRDGLRRGEPVMKLVR